MPRLSAVWTEAESLASLPPLQMELLRNRLHLELIVPTVDIGEPLTSSNNVKCYFSRWITAHYFFQGATELLWAIRRQTIRVDNILMRTVWRVVRSGSEGFVMIMFVVVW